MATHSSVLACRIPGTGEPGGLPSMGSHRVGHDWSDLAAAAASLSICTVHRSFQVCDGHSGEVSHSFIVTTMAREMATGRVREAGWSSVCSNICANFAFWNYTEYLNMYPLLGNDITFFKWDDCNYFTKNSPLPLGGEGGGTNLSLAFLLLIPFIHSFTYSFIYFIIHLVNFVGQFVSARHCARYWWYRIIELINKFIWVFP